MLITNIRAKNFKTYKELDLDLSVEDDKPIILIGGDNGGGKTTLFQAIYSALYGLKIKDALEFRKILNADVDLQNNTTIELEINFTGKVLHNTYHYKIKRLYLLNQSNVPVESVTLNLNGDIFRYGSATPASERFKSESEVNKIIKANLPQELSEYFLFDAMESGKLIKEEYLGRVIKENIENVMGFNKYIDLANANEKIIEEFIAQGIEVEEERNQYKKLIQSKEELNLQKEKYQVNYDKALQFSINNSVMFENALAGKNQAENIRDKIKVLQAQKDDILAREKQYVGQAEKLLNDIEVQVFIPKLISIINEELQLIINENQNNQDVNQIDKNQITKLINKVDNFLYEKQIISQPLTVNQKDELSKAVLKKSDKTKESKYTFFDSKDINVFKQLINWSAINNFPNLLDQKELLQNDIQSLENINAQLKELRNSDTGDNEQIIESYNQNKAKINELKESISNAKVEIDKINKKLKYFDITDEEVPNPKLELLKKLRHLLNNVSNALLVSKKSKIEESMKEDLNKMLGVYKNQIDRVELSENLSDLTFKLYHKKGNEIYLDQLNAASKQIIVQVLLKSLHHYGDYNPPVMIDTVMGYLGESSRSSLLENYFPSISHQTILLSTDTEIRKDKDLEKIESFISKKYTLVRDVVNQKTIINEGYFENV